MKMNHVRSWAVSGIAITSLFAIASFVDHALATITLPPNQCCGIQVCDGEPIAVDCRDPCPPGSVCAPDGGCEPFVWVEAKCEFDPGHI